MTCHYGDFSFSVSMSATLASAAVLLALVAISVIVGNRVERRYRRQMDDIEVSP